MAIRWAVTSGNWSDVSTWNGGVSIPTIGDEVYANGYTITLNTSVNIGNGTLRNDTNENYPDILSGGLFTTTASISIIANIVSGNSIVLRLLKGADYTYNIIGNVETTIGSAIQTSHYISITIIGNVVIGNGTLTEGLDTTRNYCSRLIINGNITINGSGILYKASIYTYGFRVCDIVGNFTNNNPNSSTSTLIGGDNLTSFSIDGDANFADAQIRLQALTTVSLSGIITTSNVRNLFGNTITTLNLNGVLNQGTKELTTEVITLNNNGTINTSAPLATNITTLNLNGTINTSNDTIADFPIGTTNIQQGSHITYSQQQPLGWGELNAPADFEFEYNGSGVSTGAYIIVNKNEFQHSYPPENYVVSGTTYGDSSQFTGTMTQPLESVVLKDYVYDSGTKTGTLDTSSLDVPQDLYTQFSNITNKLSALQTRLSIADIIEALNQYTAVKVSDLASISIDTQDIEDALDDYGVATSSDLANVSTLTTTDLSNSLTTYGAAKPTDITNRLSSYGVSTLTQSQVNSSLNSYGAAKPSDVTSALNSYGVATSSDLANVSTLTTTDLSNSLTTYGAAKPTDITNRLSSYGVSTLTQSQVNSSLNSYGAAKPSDVTSALNSYGAATPNDVRSQLQNYGASTLSYNDVKNATEEALNEEHITKEDYIASIIGDVVIINNDNNNNNQGAR